MAKKLGEFEHRDDAHAFQARVIKDGSAPLACCSEHPELNDLVVVWDEQPTLGEVKGLSHAGSARLRLPAKPWDAEDGGHGQRTRREQRS